MKRIDGKSFALGICVGEFALSILLTNLLNFELPSTLTTPDQTLIIVTLSLFLFRSFHSFSSAFFYVSFIIMGIGMLLSKKPVDFLSRYVKLHLLYVVMLIIFIIKYAEDYYTFQSSELYLWALVQFSIMILIGFGFAKLLVEKNAKSGNINGFDETKKRVLEYPCPHCGHKYHSIPSYCVNCRKNISSE